MMRPGSQQCLYHLASPCKALPLRSLGASQNRPSSLMGDPALRTLSISDGNCCCPRDNHERQTSSGPLSWNCSNLKWSNVNSSRDQAYQAIKRQKLWPRCSDWLGKVPLAALMIVATHRRCQLDSDARRIDHLMVEPNSNVSSQLWGSLSHDQAAWFMRMVRESMREECLHAD